MSTLSEFIRARSQALQTSERLPLLAMTHVIYGYPTVEASLAWMRRLLEQGIELLEVQFPFSDPVADGPTIVASCHRAVENQPQMQLCLQQLGQLQRDFPQSRILLMGYLNPFYRYGLTRLVQDAAAQGIAGLIIPDLPMERAGQFRRDYADHGVEPIWLVTPATPAERLASIARQATGMLYCVSRSGVTGQKDGAQQALADYLSTIRQHTDVPLAVGFGIRRRAQVEALAGQADIAIVGSALLEAYNAGGQEAGLALLASLGMI